MKVLISITRTGIDMTYLHLLHGLYKQFLFQSYTNPSILRPILSPEAAILLVCARDRDLLARLIGRQTKLVHFNQNLQRTHTIKPEIEIPGSGLPRPLGKSDTGSGN